MLLVDRVCDVVDPVSNRYRSLLLQVILQVSAAVPKIGIEPVLPPLPLRVSIPKNFLTRVFVGSRQPLYYKRKNLQPSQVL
jgi:hypothetical protein